MFDRGRPTQKSEKIGFRAGDERESGGHLLVESLNFDQGARLLAGFVRMAFADSTACATARFSNLGRSSGAYGLRAGDPQRQYGH